MKWQQGDFMITDDWNALDMTFIHGFLQGSHWAQGIPKEIVVKALENSLCFSLFHENEQIGFGRTVSDCATFAYLADVFVVEKYRGQGLGKWLVSCIMAHPDLQGLRRWMLATSDAHRFYEQYGFTLLREAGLYMEISTPSVYQQVHNMPHRKDVSTWT